MTRQSEQLEREAEAARAGLETSLAELRLRLTAEQLLDEAIAYARRTPVATFAQKLVRDIQGRPMPLLLVAAGIAWAMANMRRRPAPAADLRRKPPVPAAAPARREWEVTAVSPAAE